MPLAVGTPSCGCPTVAGRATGLLDKLFVYPNKRLLRDSQELGLLGVRDRGEMVQLLSPPQENEERNSLTIPRGSF